MLAALLALALTAAPALAVDPPAPPPAPIVIGALPFEGEAIRAASAAFLPDGSALVVVPLRGAAGTIEVRDARTGKVTRTIQASGGRRFLFVTPDGKRIVGDLQPANDSGGAGEAPQPNLGAADVLGFVDLSSGKFERTIRFDEKLTAATLSPDGKLVALVTEGGGVRVHDVGSGDQVHALEGLTNSGTAPRVALSPDGSRLALATGGAPLKIVYLGAKGEPRALGDSLTAPPGLLAFLEDGRLAAGTFQGVHLYRPDGSAEEPYLPVPAGEVAGVSLHVSVILGRGPRGADLTQDGLVIADLAARRVLGTAGRGPRSSGFGARTLIASADGRSVAVYGGENALVVFARVDLIAAEGRHNVSHQGEGLAFAADGRTVHLAAEQGGVGVWDAETGARRAELPTGMRLVYALAGAPGGLHFALGGSMQEGIPIFDAKAGKELRRCGGKDAPHVNDLAFSHDGKTLVAGAGDGVVRAYEVSSAKELWKSAALAKRAGAVAYSPDGKDVWASSEEGLTLLDAKSGKTKKAVKAHEGNPVMRIVSSPGASGKIATIADQHAALVLWTPAGAVKRSIMGPKYGFGAIALSPDGKLLAAASRETREGTLRIFDAASGAPAIDIEAGAGADAIAFSPDGRRIALSFGSSRLRVFELPGAAEAPKKGK